MFVKKYFKNFVKSLTKLNFKDKIEEIFCNENLSVEEVTYFVY